MWLPKQMMGPEAVLIGVLPCARIREIMVQLYCCTHIPGECRQPYGLFADPFARTSDKASKSSGNYYL